MKWKEVKGIERKGKELNRHELTWKEQKWKEMITASSKETLGDLDVLSVLPTS